jgi:hypothetical protein
VFVFLSANFYARSIDGLEASFPYERASIGCWIQWVEGKMKDMMLLQQTVFLP